MIYCVVPRPLADELYPKMVEHYRDDPNVTVIIDRRQADRRGRAGTSGGATGPDGQRRVIRDRRRARVPGELPALANTAAE